MIDPTQVSRCPDCDGDGILDSTDECPRCSGTGEVYADTLSDEELDKLADGEDRDDLPLFSD